MKRSIYLSSTDIEEAKRIFDDAIKGRLKRRNTEIIPSESAYGQIGRAS